MRTNHLDIRLNRNADYFEEWEITDLDGDPVNLEGCTFLMRVRRVNGQGAIVGGATITPVDLINGCFNVRLSGSSFGPVASGSEVVNLAYDLVITYPDGIKTVPVAGKILLTPGASY